MKHIANWLQKLGLEQCAQRFAESHISYFSDALAAPDDSLVIDENGHTYAAACLPESGWQFAEAWDILDQLKPDSIPINVRLWLAGIIAGALDRVAKERGMSAFDLRD